MRRILTLGVGLSLLAASPIVFAQKKGAAEPNVQYKSKTTYDFDDDVVEGDLVRPEGELIAGKTNTKHSSLIKIRDTFVPEMLKSAEDI